MFGFGGGLISIPLLSIFLGVKEAVTLVLIAQLLMGLLIWKTYKDVRWPLVLPMSFGLVFGTIAGTLTLSISHPNFLRIVLALLIIIFLIKNWFFKGEIFKNKKSFLSANIAGLFGGLFQGLIGTGGPVLTMYLSSLIKEKAVMRASLIYLFFITSVVRVIISVPQGLFTNDVLKMGLIVTPFFLLAITLGQISHHKLSETWYLRIINILLLVSAIVLLVKAL